MIKYNQSLFLAGGLIALVTVVSLILYRDSTTIVISCILGWSMSLITVSDLRYYVIPDIISLPAIIAGIMSSVFFSAEQSVQENLLASCLASILGFSIFFIVRETYRKLRNREGLGMGDVKIAAVAGAWTGFSGLNPVILIACITAFATIFFMYMTGYRIRAKSAIPFGAFLAPSIWIVWSLQSTGIF